MARLDAAFAPAEFDAATSVRCFRIAATDYSSAAILPALVGDLSVTAPNVSLRMFPANRIDVVAGLDERRLDLMVGWFGAAPAHISRCTLLTETETLVVRPGHALAGKTVSPAEVLAFPQLVVELTGGEPQSDEGFTWERGVKRRTWINRVVIEQGGAAVAAVAVTVPHYAAVAPMLGVTNMVATLPRRLAETAIAPGHLAQLRVHGENLVVDVEALWHDRADRDPGLRWLVDKLRTTTAS